MKYKVCVSCKDEKDSTCYNKDTSRKDGLYPYCKSCLKAKRQGSEYGKLYYQENKAASRDRLRGWQSRNRDKTRASCRKYYAENRDSEIVRAINKRNERLCRTISLTVEQKEQIREFYWLAKDLQAVSGEVYHVDHIVPLKGENICGLHVPWNLQILPADINLSKGNRYADDA